MNEVKFIVNKADVYDEVAKTTSYAGAKMPGDDKSAYDRIFTTDEDRTMLERFWAEACNAATDLFKPFLLDVTSYTGSAATDITQRHYEVTLELSGSFDTSLNGSIGSSLFSFFTDLIVSKWFKFANKGEAEGYAAEAAAMLEDVRSKLYYRKKPRRIAPTE